MEASRSLRMLCVEGWTPAQISHVDRLLAQACVSGAKFTMDRVNRVSIDWTT